MLDFESSYINLVDSCTFFNEERKAIVNEWFDNQIIPFQTNLAGIDSSKLEPEITYRKSQGHIARHVVETNGSRYDEIKLREMGPDGPPSVLRVRRTKTNFLQ